MIGFIRRLFKSIVGDIKAVSRWVLKLIAAVYSYFDRIVAQIWRAAADIWKALIAFSHSIRKWALGVVHDILWIVHKIIPAVTKWVLRIFNDLRSYAIDVFKWAQKAVNYLLGALRRAVDDITRWVIANIWHPLFSAITIAWSWITHEGAYIFDLVTHPDKLVKVLGKWLWQSWLDLIRQFAQPIAKWLLHEMVRMPDELANVLDILISSIL